MATLSCRHCGSPVSSPEPIPRDSECRSCGRDLRACRNCRHYDPSRSNSCRETEADPVADKLRRNFCEFFEFDRTPYAAQRSSGDARAKLDALFGGGGGARTPPADPQAEARRRLNSLFRPPADDETVP